MKKKIIWRLANRPTPAEVIDLNNSGLLTKEEAREILLSEETEETRSEESLKSEIKFLREIVEKLSKDRTQIISTIREVYTPYQRYSWYPVYQAYCSSGSLGNAGTAATYAIGNGISSQTAQSFSALNTF